MDLIECAEYDIEVLTCEAKVWSIAELLKRSLDKSDYEIEHAVLEPMPSSNEV